MDSLGCHHGKERLARFEHNDLEMIGMQIEILRKRGTINDSTVHILDHFARTLWPTEEETKQIIAGHGYVMSYDGMILKSGSREAKK